MISLPNAKEKMQCCLQVPKRMRQIEATFILCQNGEWGVLTGDVNVQSICILTPPNESSAEKDPGCSYTTHGKSTLEGTSNMEKRERTPVMVRPLCIKQVMSVSAFKMEGGKGHSPLS